MASFEIVEREHKRLLDKTVDHQPVLVWLDLGHAAVVTFKAQTVGGDNAVQLV